MNRTLTGTYERILDDKFRFAIPKPLRRQFSQEEELTLFVVPGYEQSLSLYSREGFGALTERLNERATNGAESRNFFRLMCSRADEVAVDRQGRIRIPERLVAHASLKHDLVLLGVLDHAEIWDKELWKEFEATKSSQYDRLGAEGFH